jgi:acetyl esterase/lipase
MKIPGLHPGDPEFPVCIYKPKRITNAPIYLHFHGGGYVEGNLNWDHQHCANIAQHAGVVVISVDYRLAPEHVFPAALDDSYSALCWAAGHGVEIGGDTSKIIVAGISAGAGLAGGIAWRARDEHGPVISMQVLEVPPCDVDTTRLSVREYYNMPGLKGADLSALLRIYLGDAQYKTPLPKYLLPGLNPDLKGLPPAFIVTASVDPLRDGGLAYAIRLLQAGVQVELHNFAGYPHSTGLPSFEVDLCRVMKQFLQ